MLRIYDDVLFWLRTLSPILRRIAAGDRNLHSQLKRASTAVALNLAEGMGSTGLSRRRAYRVALGEMREARAALDIAVQLGYIASLPDRDLDLMEKIVATLIKLARPWLE